MTAEEPGSPRPPPIAPTGRTTSPDALALPDDKPGVPELFARLKERLPALEEILERATWSYEDRIYRLYHQSFKVFDLQDVTREIVSALQALRPDVSLDPSFTQIVSEGMGKEFSGETNANWLPETRPIVEAFLHARYFLEMAVRHGRELDAPPRMMASGWAAVLTLYGLR